MPSRTPTDYELVLRARDDDEWAFEALQHRHRDILDFHARQFTAPGVDEDDLFQAAQIGLLKAVRSFDPHRGGTFRHYAGILIRGDVITAVVAARRGKHSPLSWSARFEEPIGDDTSLADVISGHVLTPPEQLIARETLRRQIDTIRGCTERERATVVSRLNGATYEETAAELGVDVKSVDNSIQRVRRKLAAAA